MEYNYYVYAKPECNFVINKMPIWFREVEYNGDDQEGNIQFHSQNDYDEIWGPNARMELAWEKKEREGLYIAKEIENSISTYNAIGLVITSKENTWLQSHEFTFWYGKRTKMIRKRYYPEKSIHGIFYCDMTERIINIHTVIIDKYFKNFKPFIEKAYTSMICHSI